MILSISCLRSCRLHWSFCHLPFSTLWLSEIQLPWLTIMCVSAQIMFFPRIILLLLTLLLSGPTLVGSQEPTQRLTRHEKTERHMAVDFTIVMYTATPQAANEAFTAAFAIVAKIDQICSDYAPNSELSLLSQASPTSKPVRVSDELWQVLVASQRFSEQSNGVFDVTVGPLTRLWRRARRQKELPESAELQAALAAVGWRKMELHAQEKAISLTQPGMKLDLGGIAQGYAADLALTEIQRRGIRQALVDASGDISLGDAPPDSPGWRVGISPLKADEPPEVFLSVANCAVSTSGDAYRGVEIGGVRYSHIVDPATGVGLKHRSNVTIIAPNGITADALATAVSVLGSEQGIALLAKFPGTCARLVTQDATGQVHETAMPEFRKYAVPSK